MYVNWNLRAELSFRGTKWFNVNDIAECAQVYRESLFTRNNGIIPEDRFLNCVSPRGRPFGPETRFPRGRRYISQGFGDWDRLLHNLFLVASALAHHDKLERGYKKFRTLGDAEITMLEQLNEILTKLEKCEDVFDRAKFEATFDLQWGTYEDFLETFATV